VPGLISYPERVETLVLVSPVGVPHPEDLSGRLANAPWYIKLLVQTFRGFWTLGITPQAVVRAAGPFGHSLVKKYVYARFTGASDAVHVPIVVTHWAGACPPRQR
jgi:pimeloyl-ACP methyl ester carboxylesterase